MVLGQCFTGPRGYLGGVWTLGHPINFGWMFGAAILGGTKMRANNLTKASTHTQFAHLNRDRFLVLEWVKGSTSRLVSVVFGCFRFWVFSCFRFLVFSSVSTSQVSWGRRFDKRYWAKKIQTTTGDKFSNRFNSFTAQRYGGGRCLRKDTSARFGRGKFLGSCFCVFVFSSVFTLLLGFMFVF